MKFNYLIAPLALIPLCSYSQHNNAFEAIVLPDSAHKEHTVIQSFTSDIGETNLGKLTARSSEVPTQIIRMDSRITSPQLDCDQVNAEIDRVLVNNITKDKFAYTTYIKCTFDPNTHLATRFSINSYFDPINDEGVAFLNDFLTQYNGSDFLGTQLKIEQAQGVIASINIAAGMKKSLKNPPFIEYRQDRSNFHFKNNYDLRISLYQDIKDQFYSDDPQALLPFLDKWVFPTASGIYEPILRDSNYIELQPELIFLMDNGEDIYVSGIKYYFAHHCEANENHRCLKRA